MKEMKTLCKVKESCYENFHAEILEAVSRPKYICEKCLRVSAKKDLLCRPCALNKWRP